MSIEISKLKTRVNTLSHSLDDLEAILEPLFSQTLPETVINLEPLQQAKLQTDIPYVIYDLVFMYLKLKGIDPKSHPVIGELDRIREYFDKISNTENPPQRRAEIDKAAANRFIKHAISSVKWSKTAAEDAQDHDPSATDPSTSTSTTTSLPTAKVQAKITSKMLQRQEYERQLKEKAAAGESEEEGLEVFGEEDEGEGVESRMQVDEVPPTAKEAGGPQKRQRPTASSMIDADANDDSTPSGAALDAEQTGEPTPSTSSSIPQPKSKKKKTSETSKKKKAGKKKAAGAS